jgi:hypothetical protein
MGYPSGYRRKRIARLAVLGMLGGLLTCSLLEIVPRPSPGTVAAAGAAALFCWAGVLLDRLGNGAFRRRP